MSTMLVPATQTGEQVRPVGTDRERGRKFRDPRVTACGAERAVVHFRTLETLWINTGTLCNIACAHCYIESSPRNDRLVYITGREVAAYLDEIEERGLGTRLIGFTGGEPFMNPHFMAMLGDALKRGFQVLVLTNAMKPMWHRRRLLARLRQQFGTGLQVRVSVDHYTRAGHEAERGPGSWEPMLQGLHWLNDNGFAPTVAGRMPDDEPEQALRAGFGALFAAQGLEIDANDPAGLVLFPEMDEKRDVPEITEQCWDILSVRPDQQMCASARMIVKRRNGTRPVVVACTLLPYDPRFELGESLIEARRSVRLNHPHCARFCVLGGASCSAGIDETGH